MPDLNSNLANALLDRFDTEFPAGSILEFRTGAAAGADNAAGGTLLASITTPASPWNAAASKIKTKNGTWTVASAVGTGQAAHYRLKNAADTRRIEGPVTGTGGGGEIQLDNVNVVAGNPLTVTALQIRS